jgi:hypothetical protein
LFERPGLPGGGGKETMEDGEAGEAVRIGPSTVEEDRLFKV